MNETLQRVQMLLARGEAEVSKHGLQELAADGILLDDIVAGLATAVVVEDYPSAWKGPSVLVLQRDDSGMPVHALWGFPRETRTPAVLITAYRPDPLRWSADFMRRQ